MRWNKGLWGYKVSHTLRSYVIGFKTTINFSQQQQKGYCGIPALNVPKMYFRPCDTSSLLFFPSFMGKTKILSCHLGPKIKKYCPALLNILVLSIP